MMKITEVRAWLDAIAARGYTEVGIDDGGLMLTATAEGDDEWLEVGGWPEDDEDDNQETDLQPGYLFMTYANGGLRRDEVLLDLQAAAQDGQTARADGEDHIAMTVPVGNEGEARVAVMTWCRRANRPYLLPKLKCIID